MTTQTAFVMGSITSSNPVTNISGFPIPSGTPSNIDILSYNTATRQWNYAQPLIAATAMDLANPQTVTAQKTFTGGFTVGANGTRINTIDYDRPASTNVIPAGGSTQTTITYGPFTSLPTVVATATSGTVGDAGISVIATSVGLTSAIIKFQNYSAAPTVGAIRVNWIAMGL